MSDHLKRVPRDDQLAPTLEAKPVLAPWYPDTSYDPYAPRVRTLRDYWQLVLKYRWEIIALLVICGTLGTIATLKMTRLYEAKGVIAYYREDSNALGFKDNPSSGSEDDYDYTVGLETQVRILQSDIIALDVIRTLHLDNNPKFAPLPASPTVTKLPQVEQLDPKHESDLLAAFRSRLTIRTVRNTRLIEIAFLGPDASLSAQIVNAVINAYTENNFTTRMESSSRVSYWLSKQISDLKLRVETSQEQLVRYQKENDILGIDEKQNIITAKLDELNKDVTQVQGDRIQKEALYKLSSAGDPDNLPASAQSPLMQKLREQEADLRRQDAQARTQFGPSHPKAMELSNQLAQIEKSIKAALNQIASRTHADYLTAVQRENMLRTALEAQKQEANRLNESAIQYNVLKRDADSNRQLYDGLVQRMKEANVSAGLRSGNIRLVDTARVPQYPSSPNIPRNIALSLFMGLLAGLVWVFTAEALDNAVDSNDDVEALTGLPTIGSIPMHLDEPQTRKLAAQRLLTHHAHAAASTAAAITSHSQPYSQTTEAYRALRTALLLSRAGAPPRVILVTSALPQEGKTTTVINLAVVLANKGARVLLIDADFRRPSVHKTFGLSNNQGLSAVLAGTQDLATAIIPIDTVANLSVLPAGPHSLRPAELIGSDVMSSLLDRWRQEYDHVLIDSPPVLSVTDAALLSVQADTTLFVVRSEQTPKDALRRAMDILVNVNANVLGVVLNAVGRNSREHYYYKYYSGYGSPPHEKAAKQ